MSRITTLENATVVRELVAPTTTINWEPSSNSGTLTFHVEEITAVNGEALHRVHKTSTTIPLTDLISRSYDIEVEPGVFTTVPGGVIMLAFKKAFELAVEEGQVVPQ